MTQITAQTKCDEVNGTLIHCPDCKTDRRLFHFNWSAIICYQCDKVIDRDSWEITETQKEELALEVGDIGVSNWGATMTLVNFYIVEKRTAKTIWWRPIGSTVVDSDEYGQAGHKVANTMDLSPSKNVFRKKVLMSQYFGEHTVANRWGSMISKWNGKPQEFNTYD